MSPSTEFTLNQTTIGLSLALKMMAKGSVPA